MTVKQAREAARRWLIEEGCRIPGFCGGYTAGSTNWLSDDTDLPPASDVDIMLVLKDKLQFGTRGKLIYGGALLEISHLHVGQFQSAEKILSDYHLAPSFRTAPVMLDPSGRLAQLAAAVSREYHQERWIRQRCFHAQDRVLGALRSFDGAAPTHDQVIACFFAAGITTHILLVAGLENPTVRRRYVVVRELLARYGVPDFHETLLTLLGAARISRDRVRHHLKTLSGIYDKAASCIRSPFPFSTDISEIARPVAIDGCAALIGRGYHREAMFWIGVTHARCQKVFSHDALEQLNAFRSSYQELLADLGLATLGDRQRRCTEIERALPQICKVAELCLQASRSAGNRDVKLVTSITYRQARSPH